MWSDKDYIELIKTMATYIDVHETLGPDGEVVETRISYSDGYIKPYVELSTGQADLLSVILQT